MVLLAVILTLFDVDNVKLLEEPILTLLLLEIIVISLLVAVNVILLAATTLISLLLASKVIVMSSVLLFSCKPVLLYASNLFIATLPPKLLSLVISNVCVSFKVIATLPEEAISKAVKSLPYTRGTQIGPKVLTKLDSIYIFEFLAAKLM